MYRALKWPDKPCFWKAGKRKFRPVVTITCSQEIYDRVQVLVEEDALVLAMLVSISGNKAGPYERMSWFPQGLVDIIKELPPISELKKGRKREHRSKTKAP